MKYFGKYLNFRQEKLAVITFFEKPNANKFQVGWRAAKQKNWKVSTWRSEMFALRDRIGSRVFLGWAGLGCVCGRRQMNRAEVKEANVAENNERVAKKKKKKKENWSDLSESKGMDGIRQRRFKELNQTELVWKWKTKWWSDVELCDDRCHTNRTRSIRRSNANQNGLTNRWTEP